MKKDDIVTAAIAKAQTKLAMPEEEKIAEHIKSLHKRLAKVYEKLVDAKAENSSQVDRFQQMFDKLKYEINDNLKTLEKIKANPATAATSKDNDSDLTTDNSGSGPDNKP